MSRCRGRTGGLSAEWSDWGTAAGGDTLLYHPTQTKRTKDIQNMVVCVNNETTMDLLGW